MRTVDFLDLLKKKLELPSDYALAKRLEVDHTCISNYRGGKSAFDSNIALRAAELLGMPAGYVLACIEEERAERTKRPQVKAAWRKVADALAPAIAILAVGIGAAAPLPSPAENPPLYIMSKRRRRPKTGQPGDSTGLPRALSSLAALMGVPKDRTIFA